MGFTFDDANYEKGICGPISEMNELVRRNDRNMDRIKPFVGGEELNNDPRHHFRRFAIQFDDLSKEDAQSGWPDLFEVVENRVKPQRMKDKRDHRREQWWQHGERQPGLYIAVASLDYVFALSFVSSTLALADFRPT
jgi:hypothetical protein